MGEETEVTSAWTLHRRGLSGKKTFFLHFRWDYLLKKVREGTNAYIGSVLLIVCAVIWVALPYAPVGASSEMTRGGGDKYDPRIGAIHDLDALQLEIPHYLANTGHPKRDLAIALTKLVELHSVHGVARQSWRENWIANVLDKLAPEGVSFAGRMRPEDLIKENVAFCSQASILLQEMFRRNGITYATVAFNVGGPALHSAVAGNPDGVWRFYDPSYEPLQQGVPFDELISSDKFLSIYSEKRWAALGINSLYNRLAHAGKIKIVNVNGGLPVRGIAFQRFTEWLSTYGWLFPAAFGLLQLRIAVRLRSSREPD